MHLTNVNSNALQVALKKIRKNANVRSLAQTSNHFRSVANPELCRRHVDYNAAVNNARHMYDNLRAHYEVVSSGEGYGSNNIGVADTITYWTIAPSKHAVLLKGQNRNPKRHARRMRKIRKYPEVYRKERNNVARIYLLLNNSNNINAKRHRTTSRTEPIIVN